MLDRTLQFFDLLKGIKDKDKDKDKDILLTNIEASHIQIIIIYLFII
jgi:hypothetical protein